jgi:hypothetical protein
MKKLDALIIIAASAVCAALFLASRIGTREDGGGMRAEIYAAGRLTQTVPLTGESPRALAIADGKLVLAVGRDGVAVTYADCPNQVCVHTGKITAPGQIIACLPNRALVKLAGGAGAETEVDVIAK